LPEPDALPRVSRLPVAIAKPDAAAVTDCQPYTVTLANGRADAGPDACTHTAAA